MTASPVSPLSPANPADAMVDAAVEAAAAADAAAKAADDAADTLDLADDDTLRLTHRRLRQGLSGPLTEANRWGAVALPPGRFSFHELHLKRDLPIIHEWMNDPEVARWWELDGGVEVTANHLAAQSRLTHATAYVGCLDDQPVSYWELYRADLDPLARHYAARPHDVGLHVLIGPAAHRGQGLGSLLLLVVSELILRAAPDTQRVIAEPDVRNAASIAAFRRAGFRRGVDLTLPGKTAALMIRDRHRTNDHDAAHGTDPAPSDSL
ncbi:GNAT family N-acetyltransferase [Yinghuangia seranimata]|uniref:GNAT family N-acetyltransferase n=1 Tax=Yinghuangia seranimata TaxID=408067 RepID=UPI00248B7554|nr:GNAT family N-acetyltransferase [Yinghuangia seranimata]MDI2128641.1 GNAT family N-acetyltransferase [Yinghuangia seranimata]